jgi:hypothetical protein
VLNIFIAIIEESYQTIKMTSKQHWIYDYMKSDKTNQITVHHRNTSHNTGHRHSAISKRKSSTKQHKKLTAPMTKGSTYEEIIGAEFDKIDRNIAEINSLSSDILKSQDQNTIDEMRALLFDHINSSIFDKTQEIRSVLSGSNIKDN